MWQHIENDFSTPTHTFKDSMKNFNGFWEFFLIPKNAFLICFNFFLRSKNQPKKYKKTIEINLVLEYIVFSIRQYVPSRKFTCYFKGGKGV